MRRLLLSLVALALALVPTVAAADLGDLDVGAPVAFFGTPTVSGSALLLFHEAFANATFSGTIYAGRAVDRERHTSSCAGPTERETTLANASASNLPAPIYFEADVRSIVLVEFGDKSALALGTGPATDAERPDASAVAQMGPNPYTLTTEQRNPQPGETTGSYVHAFPTSDFLSVPQRDLRIQFKGTATIAAGNLTLVQGGQSHQY